MASPIVYGNTRQRLARAFAILLLVAPPGGRRRREAAALKATSHTDTFEGRNRTLSFVRDRNNEVTHL
jgi:hypothetical protein